jgi:hypothetical protein
LSVITLGGKVRVKKTWEKMKNPSTEKGVFIVSKKWGKPKLSVGKEWPDIVGIEDIFLNMVILFRLRLLCL